LITDDDEQIWLVDSKTHRTASANIGNHSIVDLGAVDWTRAVVLTFEVGPFAEILHPAIQSLVTPSDRQMFEGVTEGCDGGWLVELDTMTGDNIPVWRTLADNMRLLWSLSETLINTKKSDLKVYYLVRYLKDVWVVRRQVNDRGSHAKLCISRLSRLKPNTLTFLPFTNLENANFSSKAIGLLLLALDSNLREKKIITIGVIRHRVKATFSHCALLLSTPIIRSRNSGYRCNQAWNCDELTGLILK
jgi:hypothetical protein